MYVVLVFLFRYLGTNLCVNKQINTCDFKVRYYHKLEFLISFLMQQNLQEVAILATISCKRFGYFFILIQILTLLVAQSLWPNSWWQKGFIYISALHGLVSLLIDTISVIRSPSLGNAFAKKSMLLHIYQLTIFWLLGWFSAYESA